MSLPSAFSWLDREPAPRILKEAIARFGTVETPGPNNNPSIMKWAKEAGYEKAYRADSTAWCGLFMTHCALQAGFDLPHGNTLAARTWVGFGDHVDTPMLGDVLVFWRGKKTGWLGHVGLYIAEDQDFYYVLGGNQGDKVSIAKKPKARLLEARRCHWRINQPPNVRRVIFKGNWTEAASSEA